MYAVVLLTDLEHVKTMVGGLVSTCLLVTTISSLLLSPAPPPAAAPPPSHWTSLWIASPGKLEVRKGGRAHLPYPLDVMHPSLQI